MFEKVENFYMTKLRENICQSSLLQETAWLLLSLRQFNSITIKPSQGKFLKSPSQLVSDSNSSHLFYWFKTHNACSFCYTTGLFSESQSCFFVLLCLFERGPYLCSVASNSCLKVLSTGITGLYHYTPLKTS